MNNINKKSVLSDTGYKVKAKPGKLLFEYYKRSNGHIDEAGFERITITAADSGDKLRLDVHEKEPSAEEVQKSYIISAKALLQIMTAVKKYRMHRWSRRKCDKDGEVTICRFIHLGRLVSISSQKMPENGNEALCEIYVTITKYIDEKNMINSI